ncbi:MAG: CotH kinase family protein [Verrucomicrobia bacterium]|nr:CotH kinase family protein [Verrucomicrobiota bacterium]
MAALIAACHEKDPALRWAKLGAVLDLDRFISFMATEVMICHRDGYCLARNNYRIYHDPDRDKMIFLPHGMDQLFGRADTPVQPSFAGLAATAVIETSEGRRRYRERLGFLTTNIFDPAALSARADQWTAAIRPVLSGREASSFSREVAAVKERMVARRACLARLLSEPELKPLSFENGVAMLTNWTMADLPAGGKMERAKAPDGKPALGIRAGPVTMASWHCKVLLPRGRYRFEGAISTTGVDPLRVAKNKGAGLRVVGVPLARPHNLTGDHSWTKRRVEFEVVEPTAEKELICELLASKGQAWFDLNSLRLESIRHLPAR